MNANQTRSLLVAILFTMVVTGCGSDGSSSSSSDNESPGGAGAASNNPVDLPTRISWVAPSTYSDGSPLVNLAKYRLYYGPNENQLFPIMEFPNVGSSYTFTALDLQVISARMSGNAAHWFSLSAVDVNGIEGLPSHAFEYDET